MLSLSLSLCTDELAVVAALSRARFFFSVAAEKIHAVTRSPLACGSESWMETEPELRLPHTPSDCGVISKFSSISHAFLIANLHTLFSRNLGFPFGPELSVSFSASRVFVKTRDGQVVSAPAPNNQRLFCDPERVLVSATATRVPDRALRPLVREGNLTDTHPRTESHLLTSPSRRSRRPWSYLSHHRTDAPGQSTCHCGCNHFSSRRHLSP